jgi:hypothetical protein
MEDNRPTYKGLTFEESRRRDYLYLMEIIFPHEMTPDEIEEMKVLKEKLSNG